jgi:hypothetical protein
MYTVPLPKLFRAGHPSVLCTPSPPMPYSCSPDHNPAAQLQALVLQSALTCRSKTYLLCSAPLGLLHLLISNAEDRRHPEALKVDGAAWVPLSDLHRNYRSGRHLPSGDEVAHITMYLLEKGVIQWLEARGEELRLGLPLYSHTHREGSPSPSGKSSSAKSSLASGVTSVLASLSLQGAPRSSQKPPRTVPKQEQGAADKGSRSKEALGTGSASSSSSSSSSEASGGSTDAQGSMPAVSEDVSSTTSAAPATSDPTPSEPPAASDTSILLPPPAPALTHAPPPAIPPPVPHALQRWMHYQQTSPVMLAPAAVPAQSSELRLDRLSSSEELPSRSEILKHLEQLAADAEQQDSQAAGAGEEAGSSTSTSPQSSQAASAAEDKRDGQAPVASSVQQGSGSSVSHSDTQQRQGPHSQSSSSEGGQRPQHWKHHKGGKKRWHKNRPRDSQDNQQNQQRRWQPPQPRSEHATSGQSNR